MHWMIQLRPTNCAISPCRVSPRKRPVNRRLRKTKNTARHRDKGRWMQGRSGQGGQGPSHKPGLAPTPRQTAVCGQGRDHSGPQPTTATHPPDGIRPFLRKALNSANGDGARSGCTMLLPSLARGPPPAPPIRTRGWGGGWSCTDVDGPMVRSPQAPRSNTLKCGVDRHGPIRPPRNCNQRKRFK